MVRERRIGQGNQHHDGQRLLTAGDCASLMQAHGLQRAKDIYGMHLPRGKDPWKTWRKTLSGAIIDRVYRQAHPQIATMIGQIENPLPMDQPITDQYCGKVEQAFFRTRNILHETLDVDVFDMAALLQDDPTKQLYQEAMNAYRNQRFGLVTTIKRGADSLFIESLNTMNSLIGKNLDATGIPPTKDRLITGMKKSYGTAINPQVFLSFDRFQFFGAAAVRKNPRYVDNPHTQHILNYKADQTDIVDDALVFNPDLFSSPRSPDDWCPGIMPNAATSKINGETETVSWSNTIREAYKQLDKILIAA